MKNRKNWSGRISVVRRNNQAGEDLKGFVWHETKKLPQLLATKVTVLLNNTKTIKKDALFTSPEWRSFSKIAEYKNFAFISNIFRA